MSVASDTTAPEAGRPRWHWFLANLRDGVALVSRKPRRLPARPAWRSLPRVMVASLVVVAIIFATMSFLDVPAAQTAVSEPEWLNTLGDRLSDYGTSDWFLVPTGLMMLGLAALVSPALPHTSRLVAASLFVRIAFVFDAIALPGLFVTVIKRLIGRARPYIGDTTDPFLYAPFGWSPDYSSFPSGHATNVFAALVAIGVIFPRLRGVMLLYALAIAAARVIVSAHHVSDVMAGAAAGAVGALLVRDWFAARRLGFAVAADGSVRTLPGPSLKRLLKVARQSISA
jgi:membrane-associated phospholipid phosphatase